MPGDSGVLVVTRVRSINTIAHEAAGATGARHSPRPQGGETTMHNSGASRRKIAKPYLMNTNAPHSQPSYPAKAGYPVFRGVSDGTGKLWRTGYSAGACHRARRRRDPVAEYDDSLWSSAALHRPDFDDVGHEMLQQILDAVLQRRGG